MLMNRSKVVIYMDIMAFIIASIIAIITMLKDIINISDSSNPATIFVLIYMINLLFYRICIEIAVYKLSNIISMNLLICTLAMMAIVTTLLLIVYLLIMAFNALWGYTLAEILRNHITYATIVGSWFILHLANDNMTALYNIYTKKVI